MGSIIRQHVWAACLDETESLSSKKKNSKYLTCVIDVSTKYALVIPLNDKRDQTVLNAFIERVNESN